MARFLSYLWLLLILAACASAKVNDKHPLLQKKSAEEVARVYFIRPAMRFSRANDRAVKVLLDNVNLLSLDKGSYTLLYLSPGDRTVTAESYTHYGPEQKVIKVKEKKKFHFRAGQPYYVLLKPYERGYQWGMSYQPTPIDHAVALREAASLKALGHARAKPLTIK